MKKPLILLYVIILGLCLVRCSDDTDESNRQNYWSYCNPELSPSCSGPVFRAAVNGITPENCYVWAAMLDHDQLVAYGPSRWVRAGSFDALPVSIEFAGLNLVADYEYDIMYYQTVDPNLVGQPAGRVAAGGPHKLSFTQAEVDLIAYGKHDREVDKVKNSRTLDTECFMTGGLAILKLVEDEFGAWYIDILPCNTAVDHDDNTLHWQVRTPAGTRAPALIEPQWGGFLPLHHFISGDVSPCTLLVVDNMVPTRTDTVLVDIKYPWELGYQLGTTGNEWDQLICEFADSIGVTPQLFKAQIRQETDDVGLPRDAYRYEPGYDYNYISGGGITPYKLTQNPYSLYRLATPLENGHPALEEGISLTSVDRDRGANYYNCEGDWNSNGFVSAREYIDSCSGQNWPSVPIDFTAQTAIASSYGLVQLMWPTTLDPPIRWNGGNGGDPGDLTDAERNLRFASRKMRYHLLNHANWGGLWLGYEESVNRALNYYNHNNTGGNYDDAVRNWLTDYDIVVQE